MRIQDLKDSSFFEEKEYRFFWMQDTNEPIKEIKSFERNRTYVPYIELNFGKDIIPIEEVIIGPAISDKIFAKENVTDALKHNGYDISEVKISSSTIPYRK